MVRLLVQSEKSQPGTEIVESGTTPGVPGLEDDTPYLYTLTFHWTVTVNNHILVFCHHDPTFSWEGVFLLLFISLWAFHKISNYDKMVPIM